jgi:hypothetical protein
MRWLSVAVAAVVATATPALAQTQAQQDRLDRIAKLGANTAFCARLGMTLDPRIGEKLSVAVKAETASWGVAPATIERLQVQALQRETRLFKIDLEAAAGTAKTDAQLRNVRAILLPYSRVCVEALSDPIYSRLLTAPPGFNVDEALTAYADTMLESGGLASWQTPGIQARGDMMMVAGACRNSIGGARSDALRAEFGKTDDPRARAFYAKSFDEALNDPEFRFNLVQCNGLISQNRSKIAKAKSE